MRLTTWIGLGAGAVAGLLPVSGAAAADSDPLSGADAAGGAGSTCTLILESHLFTCDTATSGRLAQETTLVASLYPAKSYIGAPTLAVRSEKGGCTEGKLKADFHVDLRYMYFYDGDHWDDEAMSFRTYSGCRLKMYDGSDGPEGRLGSTPYLDDLAGLGGIDGRYWGRKADLVALS
jgi:hypothetical protein